MAIAQLPLFSALTEKMRWHQTRQALLSENVANAETPGYRARDLAAFDVGEIERGFSRAQISTVATAPGHISVSSDAGSSFAFEPENHFEITPEGNSVSLEDEMMKVASNQMDYQTATSLYTRSMKILKTALGRSA